MKHRSLLARRWFQIVLVYCGLWMAANLLSATYMGRDVAAIINTVATFGFWLVAGGLMLVDMCIPATRRWLR